MRGKRSKQYRKAMHAYALTFGFREPYQILLDAEIIQDAARCKMKLGSMLEGVVHGGIKPMITQCCIRHLYNAEVEPEQEADKQGWIEVAKQAERRRCGHHELEEPLSALECIQSVVDRNGSGINKHKYVVASQDRQIRAAMHRVAGVPLIYINRSVMILEPLAEKTEQVRDAEEVGKRQAGLRNRPMLAVGEKRQREDEDGQEEPVKKKKKARGPKGPNPLSVMKSKKRPTPAAAKQSAADDDQAATAPKRDTETKNKYFATNENGDLVDTAQTPRKRKRKRKPQGQSGVISGEGGAGGDAEDDAGADDT